MPAKQQAPRELEWKDVVHRTCCRGGSRERSGRWISGSLVICPAAWAEFWLACRSSGGSGGPPVLSYPQKLCTWLSTSLATAPEDFLDAQYAGDSDGQRHYFPPIPAPAVRSSVALPVEVLTLPQERPKIAVHRGFAPFLRLRKVQVMCFT
jgi:hypothetical protein